MEDRVPYANKNLRIKNLQITPELSDISSFVAVAVTVRVTVFIVTDENLVTLHACLLLYLTNHNPEIEYKTPFCLVSPHSPTQQLPATCKQEQKAHDAYDIQ